MRGKAGDQEGGVGRASRVMRVLGRKSSQQFLASAKVVAAFPLRWVRWSAIWQLSRQVALCAPDGHGNGLGGIPKIMRGVWFGGSSGKPARRCYAMRGFGN